MPKEINRDKKKKYTVWSQGPDDALAKKMKRTFIQTTPGQVRDYATLVKGRSFQKFEQVKRTDEETPANATGPAVANWDPLLGGKKAPSVYVRKKRIMDDKLDGRTKAYRTVTKRIKERNAKAAERETVNKLSQFGVTSNPFREENKMDNKKYLKTKEGSIEQAVLDSLNTESPVNPNSLRPTLTLPKNRYLQTKEESVEYQAIKAVAETHVPGHLPRQLKDKNKEKMVGVKDKSGKVHTKVVDKNDPKYKDHPLHAEVEHDEDLTEKGWFPGMNKKSGEAGGGATSGTSDAEVDKSEKKFRKQKDKKRGASSSSGISKFKFFQKKDKDDQDDDPVGKDTETPTDDDDDKENGKDTETQTSKKNGDDKENGKMKKKGKKQNLRDKDDEAEGSRSKDRPTAEGFTAILDEKKEKYWAEKRKKQNLRDRDDEAVATRSKTHPTAEEVDEDEETVIITSMDQLADLDHHEFGFETRADMVEYVQDALQEKEVDVPDTRRTVDAIRAYYRSKDASRDATSDTDKGKKGKGDKEKAYAKKERGEIKKDDPDWKHKKGHTGMHGEAKDSFVVPSSASPSKAAPGEGGIPKPSDAKIDGDVKNDKKKEHKDGKEVQDIDNREDNVGESMSPLMAAVMADISRHSKKKLTESSAGGRGERDIGTDAYADYTKNLTPGQSAGTVPPANPSITSDDAKKADKKQKEDNAQKQRQATVVDDEYHPPVDMPVHEFLGIPFSAKARLARQQKKGAKIKTRTDLATAKLSNIQARDKLKAAKAKLRDARTGVRPVTAEYQPETVDRSPDKSGGKGVESPDEIMGVKVQKLKPSLKGMSKARRKVVKDRNEEMSPWIKATIDELSKKTLGSYVKKASDSKVDAGMALQRTADKNQTRGDVDKHVGKMMKRGKGISKAVDKLAKEDAASDWEKERRRQWKKAKTNPSYKDQPKEDMSLAPKGKGRKAAKRLYGEDISIVDAVQEVLGLGNKWPGMEKMPKTDPKKKTSRGTDAYVTGKSKIERLPKKEDVEMDEANPHPHLRRKGAGLADSPGARARSREGARTASQGKAGRKHGAIAPARGDWTQTQWGKGSPVTQKPKVNLGPQGNRKSHEDERGVKKVKGAKNPNAPRGHKEEVEMDEKNWIKGAIKHPGALRKSLDVPAGENIPARKLASAAKEGGKMGQRARLAQTLKKMHNEFVPENGDHPPKKAHKHDKKKDKPEQGKVYALTGKSSDASIARGDSWKDSEVKK